MPRREQDRERRRVFRRMEWVFVYAPPLLALFIAAVGGAFLAWIVPLEGTVFWQRWLGAVLIVLGLPLVAYVVQSWRGRG